MVLLRRARFISGSESCKVPIGKIEPGRSLRQQPGKPRKNSDSSGAATVPAPPRAPGLSNSAHLIYFIDSGSDRPKTTLSPTACHGYHSRAVP